jgi:hypothetical protein
LRPGQPLAPGVGSTAPSPAQESTAAAKKTDESNAPTTVPAIREIAASSQLEPAEPTYRPVMAFDGNRTTAWMTNNDGTGQSISIHFKAPASISTVSVLNSNATNETQYRSTNRVHTMRMTLSDGTSQLLTFEDELKAQQFELAKPATADWVKFDIVTVFRGKKNNHTPIAEIAFNRDIPTSAPEATKSRESKPQRRRSPKADY